MKAKIKMKTKMSFENFAVMLLQWQSAAREIKTLQHLERSLRNKIIGTVFTNLKEGTNRAKLKNGMKLVCRYSYARDVDIETMRTNVNELLNAGINLDALCNYRVTLNKKFFDSLTQEQQALVNRCLVVKPRAKTLEVENEE